MPKLQEAIRTCSIERIEFEEAFTKKVSEDIQKMGGAVQEEKKISEDSEEALLEILKEMANKMKREVENERKERQVSEDSLLSLLEETCSKLNLSSK